MLEDNVEEDYLYVSVIEDNERLKIGSLNGWDQWYLNCDSDGRDSGVFFVMFEFDSDFVFLYVLVRISQILGLVVLQCCFLMGEESNYGEVFEKEDFGLSIGICKDFKECVDFK